MEAVASTFLVDREMYQDYIMFGNKFLIRSKESYGRRPWQSIVSQLEQIASIFRGGRNDPLIVFKPLRKPASGYFEEVFQKILLLSL